MLTMWERAGSLQQRNNIALPLSLGSLSPPVNKLRCHGAIPLSLLRYSLPTPTEFRTQHSNDHEISFWVSINFHLNRMFCVAEVL